MSGEKSWTRQAREQRRARKAELAEALAAQEARRTCRRRAVLTHLAGTLASIAIFLALGTAATRSHAPIVLTMSTAAGLIVAVSVALHHRLRRRLGAMTAVAAMALASGILFLTVAALAPQCPDSAAPGRCTVGELANWTASGILLPVAGAILVGIPGVLGKFGFRLTRRIVGSRRPAQTQHRAAKGKQRRNDT